MTVHRRMAPPMAWLVLATLLAGCTTDPPWPRDPVGVVGPPDAPTSMTWAPEGRGGRRYLQSYRDGVKRVLYQEVGDSGRFRMMADLDEADVHQLRFVFVLLDGVPFDLVEQMYAEGYFRLFYPPAKLVAPFPSLTDPSFSAMFGVPGTSCYESVVFNRRTNELHEGTPVYLTGRNELWATGLDYRQRLWLDAVSYLVPRTAARREFGAMFNKAETILTDRPEQRDIMIYSISTDSAAHILPVDRVRDLLAELDRYIERLMYEHPGEIGIILLADHGNNLVPSGRKVDVEGALAEAGLRAVFEHGFRREGDVVVPRYGLISFLRAFCRDERDRMKVVEAFRRADGVEHVMWMQGETAFVARGDELASIERRAADGGGEWFSYTPAGGDPLDLAEILATLPGRGFGDETVYYDATTLLRATADHEWPDPLWRIWHGLTDHPAVAADVAASLAPGWYYGEGGLDFFADLKGTHGGLARGDTLAPFMTTFFAPPPAMRTTDVAPVINRHVPWTPATGDPASFGLHGYLGDGEK